MRKNHLSALRTDQLIKGRNLLKGILIASGILWLFCIGVALYYLINKSSGKLLLPISILPVTVVPLMVLLHNMDGEITNRTIR